MIDFLILQNKLLETISKLTIPPTWIARVLFIFNSNICYGMSFISDIKFIDHHFINDDNSLFKIKCSCNNTINNFIINFAILSLKLLNSDLKSTYLEQYISNELETKINNWHKYQLFLKDNIYMIDELHKKITTYYNSRNNDGWKESNNPVVLPNGDYRINPKIPLDKQKIIDYKAWCPLEGQKMIGSSWGKIKGLINQEDFDEIESELLDLYKNIDIEKEAFEVFNKSLNLNETEKCIAEFWAGIGGSVTPPGFWNMFMLCCLTKKKYKNYLLELKYFYELNCGLFQISIIIWNIKYKCVQARPIQTIRYLFSNEEFNYYFGHGMGNLWLPYQESRLWTPPFCDFLSGHSGFSSVGSYFMSKFFGDNIKKLKSSINSDELKLLSPLFKNDDASSYDLSMIHIKPNSSNIENNTPIQEIILKFDTWEDMAQSAGISRIYGGIHYYSSNFISLDTGKKVALLINKKFCYK